MSSSFRVFLILIFLFLIYVWMSESKWMEENWPEIEMDFFWNDGTIDLK
jgi:hypothetical protein